jgi:hypothetical protein
MFMATGLDQCNKFFIKLRFISDENLRSVSHRAINQHACAVTAVGAVARQVQYFIVIAIFLVDENATGICTSQWIILFYLIDISFTWLM